LYTHDIWVFVCGEWLEFIAEQGRTRKAYVIVMIFAF
jgi:hypothetical protein